MNAKRQKYFFSAFTLVAKYGHPSYFYNPRLSPTIFPVGDPKKLKLPPPSSAIIKMSTGRPSEAASDVTSSDEIQHDAVVPPVPPPVASDSSSPIATRSPQEPEIALTTMPVESNDAPPRNEEEAIAFDAESSPPAAASQSTTQQLPKRLQTLRSASLAKFVTERPKYLLRPIRRPIQMPLLRPKKRSELNPSVRKVGSREAKQLPADNSGPRHERAGQEAIGSSRPVPARSP